MTHGSALAFGRFSKTRSTVITFAAAVLAALATSVASAQAPAAAPRARVVADKTTHDFGLVGIGTDPGIDFPLRNSGDAPLELNVTYVPRGLTLVSLDRTVAPTASGNLRLELDTFQAGMTTEWHVNVLTNDPEHGSIELTIRADVRAFLMLTPSSARFSFVQYGPEGGTTHIISAADETPMDVLGIDSPFDYIRATVRELKAEERQADIQGRQWRIDLTISPTAPVGPIAGYVVVRTTHPKQPRAFLPVSGFVRPLFAVTPPSVNLATVTPSEDGKPILTLVVKNFATEPIAITGASSDIAGLDAKIVPIDAGHVWRVELRLTPALPAGPFKGTLKLKTASSHVPELIVPIQGSRMAEAR